jgi:group I intron endonuclease
MEDQKEITERAGDSSILNQGVDVSASNRPSLSKPGIIYKVTNLVNGKIYIGKTNVKFKIRKGNHITRSIFNLDNTIFHNAISKYGTCHFKWEIIDQCLFADVLCEMEKFYIKKFNCKIPNGYNMTDGGEGTPGHIVTPETREKLKSSHSKEKNQWYGKHLPEELRRKIGDSHRGAKSVNFGKRMPEGTRCKISLAQRGKRSGANNPMFGMHHSEEWKEYMRKIMKDRYFSPETRAKISASKKERDRNRLAAISSLGVK